MRHGQLLGSMVATTRPRAEYRQQAAPVAGFLASSSYWQSMLNVAVRSVHKRAPADHGWQQLAANLRRDCPSLPAAVPQSLAADVIAFADLKAVVEDCLTDARTLQGIAAAAAGAGGGSVNAANARGWAPVHHAAFLGGAKLLAELLALGADPALRTAQGHTALHIAVLSTFAPAVQVLLAHEPGLAGLRDVHGRTAADLACLHAKGALGSGGGAGEEEGAEGSFMSGAYRLLLQVTVPCHPPSQSIKA